MLNVRFKTFNFVQFSWDAVCFFFSWWHIYKFWQSLLHASSSLSMKILKMFCPVFVLCCILFLFCCSSLFYCGFTFNIFIRIVYKIGGLNLLVIAGTYVISFATLDYWLKPNEYFILWGKGHIYIYIYIYYIQTEKYSPKSCRKFSFAN